MIFLGIAEAAMRRDCLPSGIMARTRREELGAVRLGAAGKAAVVEPRSLLDHQPRRFQIHPFFGERMLDALVLTDWPVEHDALLGILGRTPQRVAADADRLGAEQDALGVEAVEDIGEPLAFLADPVLFGNEQPTD